ncbi:hypothetical protein ASE01_12700 [Nocardioides sp. Root190]|uniref:glycosyltransferase family 4 protein n=1 Tax=Nocardioides sp. Root190 TaxID=1736488 RepID=UPI0006F67C15|nr:glycosyltransferase family 4 protein [Nocardioides sp. Root190]KRB75907.1 hypothetical protein ASE01_12700 [Nocardioides sp. Root190]
MTPLTGARVVVVNWRDPDHSLAGGAEIYAWQFARALRDGGARVTFLTAREDGQAPREERDGIALRRGGGTLGFYLFVLAWLLRHRRQLDAVIDPACGLPSFSPLVLRRSTPALLVVHHVHQDQFAVHFPAPVAAFGRWMERVAMPRVYRRRPVAAVSDSTAAEMRRQLGWTGEVLRLENGADLPSYDARDAVTKDPLRIVVLGRLVTHKRVDLALEAVARLGRGDVRVDVIGQGPEHDRLLARADELGLADQVRFHGFLPGPVKDDLLARASVHLCASDAEGWGQAVIDAAGSGVPTVARDVPGLRDSIRHGESGWLVADDTDHGVVVARMADAVAQALESAAVPSARVHRADACLAWAHKFDWSQMRENARDLTIHMLVGGATVSSDRHQPRVDRVAV